MNPAESKPGIRGDVVQQCRSDARRWRQAHEAPASRSDLLRILRLRGRSLPLSPVEYLSVQLLSAATQRAAANGVQAKLKRRS